MGHERILNLCDANWSIMIKFPFDDYNGKVKMAVFHCIKIACLNNNGI